MTIHDRPPPSSSRRVLRWAAPLVALSVGCSLPGHGGDAERGSSRHWFDLVGSNQPGEAQITAVAPPPYDASKLGDMPPTLEPADGLGSTPAAFAVGADGAATYTIPIALPPGRAGLEPSIALTYNSGAGNGPVGVGFSLAGFSALTRCGSNLRDDGKVQGVRLAPDDHFCLDGARLVATSGAYGADGTEYHTVPDTFVKVISHGGVSDAAGYTGPRSFTVYAKDGRILEFGTTLGSTVSTGEVIEKWAVTTVRDRSGNSMTYGYQASASSVNGVSYVWEQHPFDVVYTAHANGTPADRRVAFTYENRPDFYESYEHGYKRFLNKRLRRITVTGPGGELARRYELAYDVDADVAGQRSRLASVTECATLACKRPTRFRWAEGQPGFDNLWSTGVPSPPGGMEQTTVMDVDGDGRDDIVYPDDERWHIVYSGGPDRPDGLAKHVATTALTDAPQVGRWQRGLPFDYNLDGRTDLLLADQSAEWRVLVSTGNDFTLVNTGLPRSPRPFDIINPSKLGIIYLNWLTGAIMFGATHPGAAALDYLTAGTFLADLDGDGAKDLIDREIPFNGVDSLCYKQPEACGGPWRFYRHNGGGFDPPVEIEPLLGVSIAANVMPFDVDSDGKDEILFNCYSRFTLYELPHCPDNGNGPFRILRWTGAGFEASESGLPAQLAEEFLKPVDVNGDGLKDIFASNHAEYFQPDFQPTLWLNTGRGFTYAGAAVGGPLGSPGDGRFAVHGGDISVSINVDYDGREDLLVPNVDPPSGISGYDAIPTKFWLLRAQGDHFTVEDPNLPYQSVGLDDTWYFSDRQGPKAADIDGDGQQDIALVTGGTFEWYQHKGPTSSDAKADLLTAVYEGSADFDPVPQPGGPPVNPLGTPTHRIFYAPLTDAYRPSVIESGDDPRDFYRRDAGAEPCVYPCARYVGPRHAVSYHIDDTSAEPGRAHEGPARFVFYAYDEARVDRHGRGWLGFRARSRKEFFTDEFVFDGPPNSRSRRERWERTVYDNVTFDAAAKNFPFAGRPQLQFAYGYEPCAGGGTCRWLSSDLSLWSVRSTYGDLTHFAYPFLSQHTEYERVPYDGALWSRALDFFGLFPSGAAPEAVRSSLSSAEVDGYGNATSVSRSNGPGFPGDPAAGNVTRVVTEYGLSEADWLISQPTLQTATDTVAAGSATRVTRTEYDPSTGLPNRVLVAAPGDVEHHLVIGLERDAFGNVTRRGVTDAAGEVRDEAFTYEADGTFLHAHRNALGHTAYVKAHPLFGTPAVAVDANGLRSTWQYDGFGVLRAEAAPDGSGATHWLTRERQGEAFLLEAHTQSTSGAYAATRFDRLGRPIREVARALGGQDLEVTRRYWAFGAPRRETLSARVGEAPAGLTEYDYDSQRRPSLTTLPEGTSVGYRYEGRTTFTRNPRGFEGYATTNNRGQVIESSESTNPTEGASRRFRYGPFGALVRSEVGVPLSDAPGEHPTAHVVDAYGRVRETVDPERGRRTMTYNPFGELVAQEDALGRQRYYDHDALGRVTLERLLRVGGSTLEAETTYQYDSGEGKAIGRLTRVAHSDYETGDWHQLVYRRDALSRVVKLDNVSPDPDTGVAERIRLTFGYDGFGRPSSVTYPTLPGQATPLRVDYRYDPSDHLRAVADAGSGVELWAAEAVDQAGRITRERFGSGARTEPRYDPLRGLLGGTATYAPGAPDGAYLHAVGYLYDENGNVTRRVQDSDAHEPQAEAFAYDALDRLTSGTRDGATSPRYAYTYDRLGNLTSKSGVGAYTYEATRPQVLATAGGQGYGHDAVGNQVARPGGVTVAYNVFGLPTRIAQNGVEQASFAYDGHGQRVRKTTAQGVDTYAADFYERRRRPDGSVRHTLRVQAAGRPVAERVVEVAAGGAAAETTRYLHPDRLGSPYLVTDEAGAAAERRSYDPFGAPRHPDWAFDTPPPGPVTTEVGFTGHDDDGEVGLVHMRGRSYDARLGRFLQPDPIVQAPLVSASWNRYSYVWNNPLGYTDPSGFQLGQEAPFSNEALLQRLEAEDRSKPGYDPAAASSSAAAGASKAAEPAQQASPAGHREAASNGPVGPGASAGDGPYVELPFDDGGLGGGLESAAREALLGTAVGLAQNVLPVVGPMLPFPKGGAAYELGRGLGLTAGGLLEFAAGLALGAGGGALTATGEGAPLGVPALVEAGALLAGGAAAVGAGAATLAQAAGQNYSFSTSRGPGSSNKASPSGSPAARAAQVIKGLPQGGFKLGNCANCADAMQQALQKSGVQGNRLSVRVVSPLSGKANWKTYIWSDRAGANIADNGIHEAIQVGDMVFDNLNPSGLPRALWEADLHAPGPLQITASPF